MAEPKAGFVPSKGSEREAPEAAGPDHQRLLPRGPGAGPPDPRGPQHPRAGLARGSLLAGAVRDPALQRGLERGFLEIFEPDLIGWPDMVVLTGLIASFDRLKHLAAYMRNANPRVILVAGGQAIRAFSRYARRFFDYVCLGDVEQMRDVVREAWGRPTSPRRWSPATTSPTGSARSSMSRPTLTDDLAHGLSRRLQVPIIRGSGRSSTPTWRSARGRSTPRNGSGPSGDGGRCRPRCPRGRGCCWSTTRSSPAGR